MDPQELASIMGQLLLTPQEEDAKTPQVHIGDDFFKKAAHPHRLTRITDPYPHSSGYSSGSWYCDLCHKSYTRTDAVYHCTSCHPGFDLCPGCAATFRDDVEQPAALKGVDLVYTCGVGYMRVEMKKTFVNHLGRDAKAKVVYPLPQDTVMQNVKAMIMAADGTTKVLESIHESKAKAAAIYASEVSAGRSAVLSSRIKGSEAFTWSVGNLPANATITVESTFVCLLAPRDNVIRFPLHSKCYPGYMVAEVDEDRAKANLAGVGYNPVGISRRDLVPLDDIPLHLAIHVDLGGSYTIKGAEAVRIMKRQEALAKGDKSEDFVLGSDRIAITPSAPFPSPSTILSYTGPALPYDALLAIQVESTEPSGFFHCGQVAPLPDPMRAEGAIFPAKFFSHMAHVSFFSKDPIDAGDFVAKREAEGAVDGSAMEDLVMDETKKDESPSSIVEYTTFVIDVSGSMGTAHDPSAPAQPVCQRPWGYSSSSSTSLSRLDYAYRAFAAVVRSLKATDYFSVVIFESSFYTMVQEGETFRLTPRNVLANERHAFLATPANIAGVMRALYASKISGGTEALSALKAALRIKPPPEAHLTRKSTMVFLTDGDVHVPPANALRTLVDGCEGGPSTGWEVITIGIGLSSYCKQGLANLTKELDAHQLDLTMTGGSAAEETFAICEKFEEVRRAPSLYVDWPSSAAFCRTFHSKVLGGTQVDMWALLTEPLPAVALRVGEWEIGTTRLVPVEGSRASSLLGAGSKAFLNYLQVTSVRDKAKVAALELAMGVVDQETSLVSVEDKEEALKAAAEADARHELEIVSGGPVYRGLSKGMSVRAGSSGRGGSRSAGRGRRMKTKGSNSAYRAQCYPCGGSDDWRGAPAGPSTATLCDLSYTTCLGVPDEDDGEESAGGAGGLFDDSSSDDEPLTKSAVAPPAKPAAPPSVATPTNVPSKTTVDPVALAIDLRWVIMRANPISGHWLAGDMELCSRLAKHLPGLSLDALRAIAAKASTTPDMVLTAIIVSFIMASSATTSLPAFVVTQAKSLSASLPSDLLAATGLFVRSATASS